jgi:hypothetical protein
VGEDQQELDLAVVLGGDLRPFLALARMLPSVSSLSNLAWPRSPPGRPSRRIVRSPGEETVRNPQEPKKSAEVEFVVEGNTVKIVRTTRTGGTRGDRVVRRLRGRAVSRLTTDQILALTRKP